MSKKEREVSLGGTRFLVINLTEPLREDLEVYPGDPRPIKEVFSDIKKTGYHHFMYKISDHSFHPHGDAPSHQNLSLQEKTFDTFDMDYFFNPSFMIDLSGSPDAEEFDGIRYLVRIKKEHIQKYSDLLSKKKALIIRTGYDRWLESNKKHNPKYIPYLTKEAGKFIASYDNIKVVGIDSLTVDTVGSHSVHQAFKNKLIVEGLVNLYSIPKRNRDKFDLQTSTISIIGSTGGPIAAFAYVKIDRPIR